jgi:uncharacterized membrane protein
MAFLTVLVLCTTLVLLASTKIRIRLNQRPEDILAQRFAAGEIDEREYLMRLELLQEGHELTGGS